MKILAAIQSFEKKHANATLFIGIAIGIGVGMYVYAWFVPGARSFMYSEKHRSKAEYSMNRHHMMAYPVMKTMQDPMIMESIMSEKHFLQSMIVHHESALRMAKQVLALPDITEVTRNLATSIIDAQTTEIASMKKMLDTTTAKK